MAQQREAMEGYMAVCEAFAKLRPDLEEKLEQQFEQVVQTLASTYGKHIMGGEVTSEDKPEPEQKRQRKEQPEIGRPAEQPEVEQNFVAGGAQQQGLAVPEPTGMQVDEEETPPLVQERGRTLKVEDAETPTDSRVPPSRSRSRG
eukprot:39192-Amphidinium_carterae.2